MSDTLTHLDDQDRTDMVDVSDKAADRAMVIGDIRLPGKQGDRSSHFHWENPQ